MAYIAPDDIHPGVFSRMLELDDPALGGELVYKSDQYRVHQACISRAELDRHKRGRRGKPYAPVVCVRVELLDVNAPSLREEMPQVLGHKGEPVTCLQSSIDHNMVWWGIYREAEVSEVRGPFGRTALQTLVSPLVGAQGRLRSATIQAAEVVKDLGVMADHITSLEKEYERLQQLLEAYGLERGSYGSLVEGVEVLIGRLDRGDDQASS